MHLIYIFFCLLASCMHAEESTSDVFILPAGAVHQGDFFALQESVEISGEIYGDAYIMGGQVIVDGTIHGDLLVAAGSIDVSGKVTGNIRSLGGQILISGHVGNNATALAGNVQFLPSASIGGNVVATAGNVYLSADVRGEATVVASSLRVSSLIHESLKAYVGALRLTSKAFIRGDLNYSSNTTALIEPGAHIQGVVTYRPSFVQEIVQRTWLHKLLVGSKVITVLMNFAYTLVVGIILIKLFPRNLGAALEALRLNPWKSFTFGLVLLILLPLISLVLLMTILGVPFALTLIAANIIGFYTAKIYSIFFASNWCFTRFKFKVNRISTLFMGLVAYFFLTAIPYAGIVIGFAAMLFGLGAGVLGYKSKSRRGLGT